MGSEPMSAEEMWTYGIDPTADLEREYARLMRYVQGPGRSAYETFLRLETGPLRMLAACNMQLREKAAALDEATRERDATQARVTELEALVVALKNEIVGEHQCARDAYGDYKYQPPYDPCTCEHCVWDASRNKEES